MDTSRDISMQKHVDTLHTSPTTDGRLPADGGVKIRRSWSDGLV